MGFDMTYEFSIKKTEQEYFSLSEIAIKSNSDCTAIAKVKILYFSGEAHVYTELAEIISFYCQLKELYENNSGNAVLFNMEGIISLNLTSNSLGHIIVKGSLHNYPNSITFEFKIDQSYLPQTLEQLEEISNLNPKLLQDVIAHRKKIKK